MITNVEINISNSGPHQATVSEIFGDDPCGQSPVVTSKPVVGQQISITEPKTARLLRDFIVESTTSSVDPKLKRRETKLVDKVSAKLLNKVVLVRGPTASPTLSIEYEGPIFPASQAPLELFINSKNADKMKNFVELATGEPVIEDSYIILGSTYTQVFDFDQNLNKGYNTYQNGKKIEALSEAGVIQEEVSSAVVKYGFTAKKFFDALSLVGISVEDGPRQFEDALFEQGGTLMDVLSMICSFYGYYFYVDIFQGGIKIVDSSFVASLVLPNETDSLGNEVLGYSFTDGGASPCYVLSFFGTDRPDEKYGDGFSYEFKKGDRFTRFYHFNLDSIVKQSERLAYSRFYRFFSSEVRDNKEIFDKLFYMAYYGGKNVLDALMNTDLFDNESLIKLKIPVSSVFTKENFQKAKSATAYEDAFLYFIKGTNNDVLLPSSTKIYEASKAYVELYGRIYVSRGFSEKFKNKYKFYGGENMTVSDPIKFDTQLKDIDALKPLLWLLSAEEAEKTIRQFAQKIDGLFHIGDYYYIATLSDSPLGLGDDRMKHKLLEDSVCRRSENGNQSFLVSSDATSSFAENELLRSTASLAKDIQETKVPRTTRVFFNRFNPKEEDQDDVENGGEPEEYENSLVYYNLKTFGKISPATKVELRHFDGDISDAKSLFGASLDSLGVGDTALVSSSKTVAGLPDIEQDPLLDSISISFASDGISTTIGKSTKPILPIDQSLLLSSNYVAGGKQPRMSAGARNFFRI